MNRKAKPLIDSFMVDVATLNCSVNCSSAVKDLNWGGRGDLRDAVKQSISWYEEING